MRLLVSEIYAGKAASQSRNVYVGDAILSVNGIDLRNLKHNDAVKILTDQEGQVSRFILFFVCLSFCRLNSSCFTFRQKKAQRN